MEEVGPQGTRAQGPQRWECGPCVQRRSPGQVPSWPAWADTPAPGALSSLGATPCGNSRILDTGHKGEFLNLPREASKLLCGQPPALAGGLARSACGCRREKGRGQVSRKLPPSPQGSGGHSGRVICRDDVQGRVIRDAGGICQTCQFLARGSGLSTPVGTGTLCPGLPGDLVLPAGSWSPRSVRGCGGVEWHVIPQGLPGPPPSFTSKALS